MPFRGINLPYIVLTLEINPWSQVCQFLASEFSNCSNSVMDLGVNVVNPFIHKFHTIMLGTYDIFDIGGTSNIRGTPHQLDQTFRNMWLVLELYNIPTSLSLKEISHNEMIDKFKSKKYMLIFIFFKGYTWGEAL